MVRCYTCGAIKHWKEMDLGHYIHKDCFNHEEDLLRVQCTHCNRHLSGNLGVFAENLIKEHRANKFQKLTSVRYSKKDYTRKELLEIVDNLKPTENLKNIFAILKAKYNFKENQDFFFDPTLARGLDYYTGAVFELKPNGKPEELSIGGGGRYDNLIGMFANKQIPAVGFAFGLDRLAEIL